MAFWLKDEERSWHGLGWEFKRRGRAPETAPAHIKNRPDRWEQFMRGYNNFSDNGKTTYHED